MFGVAVKEVTCVSQGVKHVMCVIITLFHSGTTVAQYSVFENSHNTFYTLPSNSSLCVLTEDL